MFNSSPLIYCNCASVPVLHCSSVYSPWKYPVPSPTPGHGTSFDGMATHSALASEQEENPGEPSTSRRLKFGIENILSNGTSSHPDHHEVHNRYPYNQDASFITYQPFYPHMRTSTRHWCRPVFTQLQRRGLEKRFQATNYVTKRERLQIGAMLGLSETQVKVWFQNRRTKWRHEASKKKDNQKEQASKKTTDDNHQQEEMKQNDIKERNEEVCPSTSKEFVIEITD